MSAGFRIARCRKIQYVIIPCSAFGMLRRICSPSRKPKQHQCGKQQMNRPFFDHDKNNLLLYMLVSLTD
ncbi:hypothetical protein CHCC14821_0146 [Bacillus paralicheniformis]|nr:hypothetical protein CHCC14821_0146 [Bacillus paralicheniformis]